MASLSFSPAPSVPPIAQGAVITVNIFDGTRQLMSNDKEILLTVRDGFQNQTRYSRPAPSIQLSGLPVYSSPGDNYAVIAYVDGFKQAGFYPIPVSPNIHQVVNLMLVPKNGSFNFAQARWPDIQSKKPILAGILQRSITGNAAEFYSTLIEKQAPALACLLNITTAMQQVFLPQRTLLDYVRGIQITDLYPDRFFAWANPALIDQLKQAVLQGEFEQESSADLLLHSDKQHGPATSSFKQVQFGEANVQITIHEETTRQVDGETQILIEPDIDYYKDLGAHALLEVIPNMLTGRLTDPMVVYVLRWIAGQRAGIPEFDPLYTIV